MKKFLITNNVNATHNKIFKIIDSYYGASSRRFSDMEEQTGKGFLIGFNKIPESVSTQIEALKHVKIID